MIIGVPNSAASAAHAAAAGQTSSSAAAAAAAAAASATASTRPAQVIARRHQLTGREKYLRMNLREQILANFHSQGGAFERLRDRLGIRSATTKSRLLFAVLYQSVVDQIVNQMMIEAEYKHRRTLTMEMATHAFERTTGQKIYATDYGSKRVLKHSRSRIHSAKSQQLGVSRSLKPKPSASMTSSTATATPSQAETGDNDADEPQANGQSSRSSSDNDNDDDDDDEKSNA